MKITKRETEIIRLISEGYSTKQIADLLFLSNRTIETHRKNITNKLGLPNFYSVLTYAFKNNILQVPLELV